MLQDPTTKQYKNVVAQCQEYINYLFFREGVTEEERADLIASYENQVETVTLFPINITLTKCTLPVAVLYRDVHLVEGEGIVAQVLTSNLAGLSPPTMGQGSFVPAKASTPGTPNNYEEILPKELGQLSLKWRAPSDDGGADIEYYLVTYVRSDLDYDNKDLI